jgi:hypothetical protein
MRPNRRAALDAGRALCLTCAQLTAHFVPAFFIRRRIIPLGGGNPNPYGTIDIPSNRINLHGVTRYLRPPPAALAPPPSPSQIMGSRHPASHRLVLLVVAFLVATQFTGIVMDKLKTPEGRFRWHPRFLVPCGVTLVCLVVMTAMFRG